MIKFKNYIKEMFDDDGKNYLPLSYKEIISDGIDEELNRIEAIKDEFNGGYGFEDFIFISSKKEYKFVEKDIKKNKKIFEKKIQNNSNMKKHYDEYINRINATDSEDYVFNAEIDYKMEVGLLFFKEIHKYLINKNFLYQSIMINYNKIYKKDITYHPPIPIEEQAILKNPSILNIFFKYFSLSVKNKYKHIITPSKMGILDDN